MAQFRAGLGPRGGGNLLRGRYINKRQTFNISNVLERLLLLHMVKALNML
jgi:hypothetical protein